LRSCPFDCRFEQLKHIRSRLVRSHLLVKVLANEGLPVAAGADVSPDAAYASREPRNRSFCLRTELVGHDGHGHAAPQFQRASQQVGGLLAVAPGRQYLNENTALWTDDAPCPNKS